jgi:hypothetical protein
MAAGPSIREMLIQVSPKRVSFDPGKRRWQRRCFCLREAFWVRLPREIRSSPDGVRSGGFHLAAHGDGSGDPERTVPAISWAAHFWLAACTPAPRIGPPVQAQHVRLGELAGSPTLSTVASFMEGSSMASEAAISAEHLVNTVFLTGCSAAWQRACFGSRRSRVQIPAARLQKFSTRTPAESNGVI